MTPRKGRLKMIQKRKLNKFITDNYQLYSDLKQVGRRHNLIPLEVLVAGTVAIVVDKITAVYDRLTYGKRKQRIADDSVQFYNELTKKEKEAGV